MPKKVQMKEEPQGASLFQPKKRTFGIGGDIPGKRDLGRFVKWPKYVRLQRQKAVLMKRLKVPPAIAQFANTADKGTATELFRLLDKYTPETRLQKRKRLAEEAKAVAAKQEVNKGPKPMTVKYGINHITWLIEEKKAQLVVIAHDVEPIEVRARATHSPAVSPALSPLGAGSGQVRLAAWPRGWLGCAWHMCRSPMTSGCPSDVCAGLSGPPGFRNSTPRGHG